MTTHLLNLNRHHRGSSHRAIDRCIKLGSTVSSCISKVANGFSMEPVRIRRSSHGFGWQPSHSVDLAGWQAKMASIDIGYHDLMRTSPISLRCRTSANACKALFDHHFTILALHWCGATAVGWFWKLPGTPSWETHRHTPRPCRRYRCSSLIRHVNNVITVWACT